MSTFIAKYQAASGGERSIRLQASDIAAARKQLRRRGIKATAMEVEKTSDSRSKQRAGSNNAPSGSPSPQGLQKVIKELNESLEATPKVKDKAVFANKLAAMVDAGVPIVRSLDLMAGQQKPPMFKRALTQISLEVNQGIALATAMRQWPKVFDRLSIAMVEAGETGGVLDESLKRLSKLLEDNARLQNQVKGALSYPITVLALTILVFLGMTIFLIPTFASIYDDLGGELPAFTQFMLNVSALLRSSASLLIAGGLIILIWTINRYYATRNGKRVIDKLMLHTPLFGDLILKSATSQFCRIFSSLTSAGVPILSSLEISSETSGNSIVSDSIVASRSLVQEGVLLSSALQRQKVLPELALSMLAIGEETGELDKMLSKVADFYEDEVATTVKQLTSIMEPALIVIVGGIVGAILLAMYLPMFGVFDLI